MLQIKYNLQRLGRLLCYFYSSRCWSALGPQPVHTIHSLTSVVVLKVGVHAYDVGMDQTAMHFYFSLELRLAVLPHDGLLLDDLDHQRPLRFPVLRFVDLACRSAMQCNGSVTQLSAITAMGANGVRRRIFELLLSADEPNIPAPNCFLPIRKSSSVNRGPDARSASRVSGYIGLLGAASVAAPAVFVISRMACIFPTSTNKQTNKKIKTARRNFVDGKVTLGKRGVGR